MGEENYGVSLLEVFQIVYLGDDEIEPDDQAGTIKFISDHGVQYLYNVLCVDPFQPPLRCGDQIMVTVNSPTIISEKLNIEFDLFCGAYKGTIELDWEEVVFSKPTLWHEKIQSRDGTGSIIVLFGSFAYARVADIEVKILDNSIEEVYGVVAASNSKLQRDLPHCASILFNMDVDNLVYPEFDPYLSLSKSRVAVPLDATLYVDFLLNCDGKAYKERLSFVHQKSDQAILVDHSEKIQVKVTWGAADRSSILSTYNDENEGLRT